MTSGSITAFYLKPNFENAESETGGIIQSSADDQASQGNDKLLAITSSQETELHQNAVMYNISDVAGPSEEFEPAATGAESTSLVPVIAIQQNDDENSSEEVEKPRESDGSLVLDAKVSFS